ncbi:MAG: hypothetical protein AB8D52_11175 [Gammaproteobacteria bacterium]
MPVFNKLLTSSSEDVIEIFYAPEIDLASTAEEIAQLIQLNLSQLICSLGFNSNIKELLDIIFILGFESIEDLLTKRNRIFVSDIYQQISLKQILAIYDQILNLPKNSNKKETNKSDSFITTLLSKRIELLEHRIEKSVKPKLIENYRSEMKAIYKTGSIPVDFVKLRLENSDSGFRALIDEINLIVDSKIFPVDHIFLNDSVLPEEKRRLISRGLISRELVRQRLEKKNLSISEKEILENYLYETS